MMYLAALTKEAKRNWKLMAATNFFLSQTATISLACAKSLPIGFWIRTAAPSGNCSNISMYWSGKTVMS